MDLIAAFFARSSWSELATAAASDTWLVIALIVALAIAAVLVTRRMARRD